MTSLNHSPRRKSLRGGRERPTKNLPLFASICPFRICLSSFIPESRCADNLSAELHVLVLSLQHHSITPPLHRPAKSPHGAAPILVSSTLPAPRNPAPWNRASWGSANPSAARPLISMTCVSRDFKGGSSLPPPYDMNAE